MSGTQVLQIKRVLPLVRSKLRNSSLLNAAGFLYFKALL